jgi:hypothetical protein
MEQMQRKLSAPLSLAGYQWILGSGTGRKVVITLSGQLTTFSVMKKGNFSLALLLCMKIEFGRKFGRPQFQTKSKILCGALSKISCLLGRISAKKVLLLICLALYVILMWSPQIIFLCIVTS